MQSSPERERDLSFIAVMAQLFLCSTSCSVLRHLHWTMPSPHCTMYVEFNEGVYTRERELKNDDAYKPWDTIDSLAWPLIFLAVHVRIIIIAVNYNGSLLELTILPHHRHHGVAHRQLGVRHRGGAGE